MCKIEVSVDDLVRVIIANGNGELITHAIIADKLDLPIIMGDNMLVEIHSQDLPIEGSHFVDEKGNKKTYGCYWCEVVKVDRYRLRNPYLVKKPNGKTEWVSALDTQRRTPVYVPAGGVEQQVAAVVDKM